ncbi:hypothetical protein L0222_28900 [bacterium]|nr:hypothetical protein [bacterium]MCI0601717.1 hypothetical protein [bacterium]
MMLSDRSLDELQSELLRAAKNDDAGAMAESLLAYAKKMSEIKLLPKFNGSTIDFKPYWVLLAVN